jgi:hypothetical protein
VTEPDPADAYALPPEQLQHIFDTQIAPALTGTPSDTPTLVLIGGQPGSGKTTIQSAVVAHLGRDQAVPLDGDDLLDFHPGYRRLTREDDLSASLLVDDASGRWWTMAVEHIRRERLDVVITVPFGNADWAGDRMLDFRNAGYRVEVAFVALHEARSLLSVVDRYQRERDTNGAGRWVKPENHDRAYAGVLATADRVDAERLADTVLVVRRGGDVLYTNHRTADGWERPPGIRQAVEVERARPWTTAETTDFRDRAAALAGRISEAVAPALQAAVARGLAHLQAPGAHTTAAQVVAQAYPVATQGTATSQASTPPQPASNASTSHHRDRGSTSQDQTR